MEYPSEDELSDSAARRNDERCDRFDGRWRSGGRLSVEEHLATLYLMSIPQPERTALLRDLLLIEVEYRRNVGEVVTPSELAGRFPALSGIIEHLLPAAGEETEPVVVGGAGGPSAPVSRLRVAARYTPLNRDPHAVGGLGRIFRARDSELGRVVALKEIHPAWDADPSLRARFTLEAEITGILEHPGVVPIYSLGEHPDGRPYYAMRFIEGQTLQEAVSGREAVEWEDPEAAGRAGRLRKLLARFVSVCETIAYAHSRGVIHRDIKPHNIMLGPFGETLVVDWGLAKVRGGGEGEAQQAAPPSAGLGGETIAGREIGTPLYMSPEQAEGRLEEIGPASDIYGLGATLYFVLTGSPPFSGASREEVLARVKAGDFTPPRRLQPRLPAPLEAVVLRAMAFRPQDRYPTARALGEDLDRWLADEPVSAFREPIAARIRRWGRRHRLAVSVTAAASAVAALALVGGIAWWAGKSQEVRLTGQARADAATAMRLGERARFSSSPEDFREALEAAERAVESLEEAGRPAAEWAAAVGLRDRLKASDALVRELEAARIAGAAVVEGRFDRDRKVEAYRQALSRAGIDPLGPDAAAASERIRDLGVAEAVVAAVDDWAMKAEEPVHARLDAFASSIDENPDRLRLRHLPPSERNAELAALAKRLDVTRTPKPFLEYVGAALIEDREFDAARDFLGRARNQYPRDFWFNHDLGTAHRFGTPPDLKQASTYFRAAAAASPENPAGYISLAEVLGELAQWKAAADAAREAIRLDERLAAAHGRLSTALKALGLAGEAAAELRRAVELDPDYSEALSDLSGTLSDLGDHQGALAAIRRAIEIRPNTASYYFNLGYVLRGAEDLPGAAAAQERAIQLDPRAFAAYFQLGSVRFLMGKYRDAIPAFEAAVRIRPDYAQAHTLLGGSLYQTRDFARAAREYDEAVRLDPLNPEYLSNQAVALSQLGDLDGAAAAFRVLLRRDPGSATYRSNLAEALLALGDPAGSVEAAREAARLERQESYAQVALGNGLLALGDEDGAVEAYGKGVGLEPGAAEAHCGLGLARMARSEFDLAVRSLREGHRLGTMRDVWPLPSARWIALAEAAIALGGRLAAVEAGTEHPRDEAEALVMARIFHLMSHFSTAARLFAGAIRGEPSGGDGYLAACSAVQASCGGYHRGMEPSWEEKLRLRRDALAWFRSEVKARRPSFRDGRPLAADLVEEVRSWRIAPELAPVRSPIALAQLPAAERAAWLALWAELDSWIASSPTSQAGPAEFPRDVFAR
ncbi:serine/threonine-protein kinase [Aquisphaera insulae]|uniref:serine/threonine-protein kinase n=1 Tax=Aquisphaera insulae TaxID=2712864 RepID=UPI0013E9F540|nr:serine/threonine-protein kinase [Aquisphaera insulae]